MKHSIPDRHIVLIRLTLTLSWCVSNHLAVYKWQAYCCIKFPIKKLKWYKCGFLKVYQLLDIPGNKNCSTWAAIVIFTWNIMSYVAMSKWKSCYLFGFWEWRTPKGQWEVSHQTHFIYLYRKKMIFAIMLVVILDICEILCVK